MCIRDSYWACLVTVPLIVIDREPRLRPLQRTIAIYAAVYTLLVLAAQALLPRETWGYVYHIWSVIFGYLGLATIAVIGNMKSEQTVGRTDVYKRQTGPEVLRLSTRTASPAMASSTLWNPSDGTRIWT